VPGAWTNKLKPKKYYRNDKCSSACSIGPGRLGDERATMVHGWFEQGLNNDAIMAAALAISPEFKLSNGALGRHRSGHLSVAIEPRTPDGKLEKVNHLDLLEQMIAKGAQNMARPDARVSPEMSLRAMEMHYKLTQGSAMDNFLTAVTAVMSGAEENDEDYMTSVEAAEAKMARDEAAQAEAIVE
jgi:hypothetical protein